MILLWGQVRYQFLELHNCGCAIYSQHCAGHKNPFLKPFCHNNIDSHIIFFVCLFQRNNPPLQCISNSFWQFHSNHTTNFTLKITLHIQIRGSINHNTRKNKTSWSLDWSKWQINFFGVGAAIVHYLWNNGLDVLLSIISELPLLFSLLAFQGFKVVCG